MPRQHCVVLNYNNSPFKRFPLTALYSDISNSPSFGKSLRVFEVPPELINELYEKEQVSCPSEMSLFPNQPVVLKAGKQSCLGIASRNGKEILKVESEVSNTFVKGKNKEQMLLLHALKNPSIRCVVVTGLAGSGKTLLLCSHILEEITAFKNYKKTYLSKPLSVVTSGKYWGTVPGGEDDKFAPFLKSYEIQFQSLMKTENDSYMKSLTEKGIFQFMPLELMRGVSLKNCIAWFDEVQNCNTHELATLGTRIDDTGKSKLILSGDLNQRDVDLKRMDTGLMQMLMSPHFLKSPLTFHINLVQCVRGEVAELFHNIFERDKDI